MKTQPKWILALLLAFATAGVTPEHAQETNPPNEPDASSEPNDPPSSGWHRFGESAPATVPPPQQPLTLTLPAGSWITVRADQPLSSDQNRPGDAFTATLSQPLVADGRVIARRGQTVGGVVATAEKAGRVKGTSRLGLQLTELTLVNGRQMQMRTTLMQSGGGTSMGRDASAIGTTAAIGASIGAIADGGLGAGIGAAAGAAAATIGVLVTRGNPAVVYPEDVLTFRLEAPLIIPVESSQQAFQAVTQGDYEQRSFYRPPTTPGPPPPSYPYYYGGYYSPYFYGPSFYFYSGPRYFYGGGYYRGGYYRGGYYHGGYYGGYGHGGYARHH